MPDPQITVAANWAIEAVSRPDLPRLIERMNLRQLRIFDDLVSRMTVDVGLTLRFAPEAEHASIKLRLEQKNADIAKAAELLHQAISQRQ
ncbi:hypothetical protein [Pseudomonas sp. GOM6]|uniref:hypothetical protein n=1 Tax=Pseudomonas sp. GOM6 TaxID=3036944 RepID=UPI00240A6FE0|nr:hypothetical protein [Pseudomonas sp. GOM6]MDG1581045.1 hypothetical protein [Pseudomonas sp. GOM6]